MGAERGRRRRAPGSILIGTFLVLGLAGPWLAPHAPDLPRTGAAPLGDVLGVDALGRDLLSRLLAGARTALWVCLGSVALAAAIGLPLGGLAATRGLAGRLARAFTLAMLAFPRLFLLLALAIALPPAVGSVILALGLTGWMPLARVVGAEVAALRDRPFIEAARIAGAGPGRIFRIHLLPHLAGPVLVLLSALACEVLLAEAALSYLGIGVPPPEPSWGAMIADAGGDLLGRTHQVLAPGLAVCLASLGWQRLADGWRDAGRQHPVPFAGHTASLASLGYVATRTRRRPGDDGGV